MEGPNACTSLSVDSLGCLLGPEACWAISPDDFRFFFSPTGQTPAFYQVPEESSCCEQGGYSNRRQKIKGSQLRPLRSRSKEGRSRVERKIVKRNLKYAPIYGQIEQSRE